MKKFLVALCGILVVGGAMAHPDHYAEPGGKSNFGSDWNVGGNYHTNIKNYYTSLNYYEDGTYDDERAIVLVLARTIYKNGGEFCTTQVQAANKNGRQYTWIDYYDKEGTYQCQTLCESGYDPKNQCEAATSTKCDFSDHSKLFENKTIITGTKEAGRITESMDVFSFANETGNGSSDKPAGPQTARHVVLGIVDVLEHGVMVAPIEIIGKRTLTGYTGGIHSSISSALSNGKNTLLCASGYVPNSSKSDCVMTPTCEQQYKLNKMCDDFLTGFDSESHELELHGSCYEYRCNLDNYGFKGKTDRTCIACPNDARHGVDDNGICVSCTKKGQSFNKRKKECDNATQIPKIQMTQGKDYNNTDAKCWLKQTAQEFSDCVLGPSGE